MLYSQTITKDNSTCYIYPDHHSYLECVMDSGCYYITPKECKDIIINAGLSGLSIPNTIKKIHSYIINNENMYLNYLYFLKKEILAYYAGELAESLVYASKIGKGVEITVGYPKTLIIKIN